VSGVRASFIYQWFTDPSARDLYHPDEHGHQSSVFVADVRAVSARRGRDEFVTTLIRSLLKRSDEFRELWAQQHVAIRRSDRKRLRHPAIGEIELNCLSLLSEDASQRLLWFTASPGTVAVEQLELLNVVGHFQVSDGLADAPGTEA
jgi:hypothetical protein